MPVSAAPTTTPALAPFSTKIIQERTAIATKTQRPSAVSFSTVEIRWYPSQLSEDSICSAGAPLGLAWDPIDETCHDLDLYECSAAGISSRRRVLPGYIASSCPEGLILSSYQRRDILCRGGYTPDQIRQAEREVARLRRQRRETVRMMPLHRVEEVARTAAQMARKRFVRTSVPR
jgi:hypothetical protein